MSLQNRETLKSFFRKGQMPTEGNFNDLIDSMINKVDDGMSKTIDEGLQLKPIGTTQKLISFFKSIEEKNPAWSIQVNSGDATLSFNNQMGDKVLSLFTKGNKSYVGIRNEKPEYELDVRGVTGMHGRIGTLYQGSVPADGNWHPIVQKLDGCHAFEIVAGVGKQKTGKYALIHAFALSTYGKSRNTIRINQAYYGARYNKIELRWTGDTYSYNLEMRCRRSYGGEFNIQYFISSLWFDTLMNDSIKRDTAKENGSKEE
ncbi:MAG: adhesin [Microscillaceae bacterium]|nr:adhesin [Microscillaceae bacterium]